MKIFLFFCCEIFLFFIFKKILKKILVIDFAREHSCAKSIVDVHYSDAR